MDCIYCALKLSYESKIDGTILTCFFPSQSHILALIYTYYMKEDLHRKISVQICLNNNSGIYNKYASYLQTRQKFASGKRKEKQVSHFLNYTLVESTVTCSSRRMVAKSFMLLEESFAGKKYISPSS